MDAIDEQEADQAAERAMHVFNNTLTLVRRDKQLRAAKKLLKLARDLVERLEKEDSWWSH